MANSPAYRFNKSQVLLSQQTLAKKLFSLAFHIKKLNEVSLFTFLLLNFDWLFKNKIENQALWLDGNFSTWYSARADFPYERTPFLPNKQTSTILKIDFGLEKKQFSKAYFILFL